MPACFSFHPPFRLSVAFALSLILHGGLMISDTFRRAEPRFAPSTTPALQAFLRPPEPAAPPIPPEPPELLLKNTFDTETMEAHENREGKPPALPRLQPETAETPKAEPEPSAPPPTTINYRPGKPRPAERKARSHSDPKRNTPHRSSESQPVAHTPPLAAVQRKLSEFVFYPEEARVQGIEGTVYLFIQLGPDCAVEDVRIDGSSGSRLLDKAAEKGAWAVHRLPGCRSGVYPYIFRLVD